MQLREHFDALDNALTCHAALWRESVWANPSPSWAARYPQLFDALCQPPANTDNSGWLLAADTEVTDTLNQLQHLCDIRLLESASPLLSNRAFQGIKGRKANQIRQLLGLFDSDIPLFEWCCGKAHLARLHGRANQLPGAGLEYDPQLCVAAEQLAAKQAVTLNITQADALTTNQLPDQHQIAALHACGDLHTHLIGCCTHSLPSKVVIAPCCYHRTDADSYLPQSKWGRRSTLRLNKDCLRLISEQTTHATEREQRFTQLSQLWRLAFNALLNDIGHRGYTPTPSLGQSDYALGFSQFVAQQLQRLEILAQPSEQQLQDALAMGANHQQRYHQLSTLRQFFSRPLELFIVLDQALRLDEVGYQVELGTFCDASIAARNLVIKASYR